MCGEGVEVLSLKHLHKIFMGSSNFAEERSGLLPFALRIDVAVVAASEPKDVQKMALRLIILHQRLPGCVVGRSKLRQRRGTKLRMFAQKCDDLHGIDIADYTQASAPRISVAIR